MARGHTQGNSKGTEGQSANGLDNGNVPRSASAEDGQSHHVSSPTEGDGQSGEQDGKDVHPAIRVQDNGRTASLAERAASLRSGLKPPAGEFGQYHPALYEAFCGDKDKKDRRIAGASFTFAADGDAFTVFLNWPLGGVRTSFTLSDPLLLWETLEGLLTGTIKASWKEMKRTPRHLQKHEG